MTNYYISKNDIFQKIEAHEDGCWVDMVSPNEYEIENVAKTYNIEIDALKAALDIDERSRIETDPNYSMILVNTPTIVEENEKIIYDTIPLSIFITKEAVITVCGEVSPILKQFKEHKVRDFYTFMKSRFILQILYRNALQYLQYLRDIDRKSGEVEDKLHKSTQNHELIELLNLEKSLVYFTTALRSNEVVLEKLFRSDIVKKYPEDSDLLDDVIVENKQAIEMANIYSGILSGMMDAFASVISNNLNIVMKLLAIITIVMAIPTMIFSAYGMNVNTVGMPFSGSPYGFLIIVSMSVVLSLVVAIVFIKLKVFK